ncbi:MAG: Fic family protein [Halobacteriovoraceae bacterium]|nr:Fic family protein [Halobacteriovoraceae bacterium]
MGRQKVHFEAPPAEKVEQEMASFLKWFENKSEKQAVDPALKAGIAHFWFVIIHPFDDGNGRIGRVICDMALARADGVADRFYSLSNQIAEERKDYYKELEKSQRENLDITEWLKWFLSCLDRAISNSEKMLDRIFYKSRLWSFIDQKTINPRQRKVIERMLKDNFKGHMNTSKYAKIAKCPAHTALRDIQDLKTRGIFLQNPGGGRSTSYRLVDKIKS